MTETEKSHEKEDGYKVAELKLLTQLITAAKHRMVSANTTCSGGCLFIPIAYAFHDFVLIGPRNFPLVVHVLGHLVSNKVI